MRIYTSIRKSVNRSIKAQEFLMQENSLRQLRKFAMIITKTLKKGNKLLIAGNGGSASQAEHFAAELVNKYILVRRGLPAIALTTDTSVITSIANDCGYENIFSRQIKVMKKRGDLFLAISTSGNSVNIIQALKTANAEGIMTLGLLGKSGGKAKTLCNLNLTVPSHSTPRIQECHLLIIHLLCEMTDEYFQV